MEFYPMPLFVKLSVSHMENSLSWYKEVLHFKSVFEWPGKDGQPIMAHIRGSKYQDILLVSAPEPHDKEANGKGIVLNLSVKEVDVYFQNASRAHAIIVEGPVDRPWNARELVLKDPDGYLITLSMGINREKSFDDVIGQMRNTF
ncbi:VOC family protein [Pseudobacillus badius]|uniref:VOC family protein n=1 Tax=Bacillus badius TaxID=1455 RepID=UPI0007B065FF|nr:glyoxalase/bleomycin resistance/extradiol dioxygenase family protein [Bacillus badius]MED0666502.1 glyoxalase/bleomycin resistance/extradiol dioxygenase family protein [Bacillus badius]OCS85821.1 bleomycin resistance protein [Bacillus badius]OVE51821.1 glyoxalase/bleomycin resistance/extradiol dioxygenase family protein [Bacillus badius]TDW03247.1 putative glyoxalase superfamily protein PhnB [Bacillus badius]